MKPRAQAKSQTIIAFISRRCFFLAWLAILFTVVGQVFGRTFWRLELLTHFVPHAAAMLLIAGVFFPKSRSRFVRIGFWVVGFALLAWSFAPFSVYQQGTRAATVGKNSAMRIAYQNVRLDNSNPIFALQQLTRHKPDILLLVEAGGQQWNSELQTLAKLNNKNNKNNNYPVHCGHDEQSVFAIQALIADRHTTCELRWLVGFPLLKITRADRAVIFAIHPPPPINADLAREQREFLQAFKPLVQQEQNVIVIGDMNLSAFSPLYRDFIADTKLKRTTPNGLPTWLPLGLSIDQILTKRNSSVLSVTPLAWNGSDHRGFWVDWLGRLP